MADAPSSPGTFSDLYDLMQQRKAPSAAAEIQPASSTSQGKSAEVVEPSMKQKDVVTKSPNPFGTVSPKGQEDKVTNHQVTMAPSLQGEKASTAASTSVEMLSEREYFRCSQEEVEAIEDLKTELRRDHGIKSSKQDLERYAVQRLIEEYKQLGQKSFIVTKLRHPEKR